MLQRLWYAFRQDRWLQIGVLAFVVLYVGFQERLAEQEKLHSAVERMNEDLGLIDFDRDNTDLYPTDNAAKRAAHGTQQFNIDDDGPFIVVLPAPRDIVMQSLVARLSGREVHLKDENGQWRILDPVFDSNGNIQDHSATVVEMAKLGCSQDAPPELKRALLNFNPTDRRVFCSLAEQN